MKKVLYTDVNGDSNLDLILAILALSTAVFIGHLASLAADDAPVLDIPRSFAPLPPS